MPPMGNKISCANCNGNKNSNNPPTTGVNATTSSGVRAGIGAHYPHYHPQSATATAASVNAGAVVPASGAAAVQNLIASGQTRGHVLRLWAEVFHVSASSGAVRWSAVSDDLIPITVTYANGRFHVAAFNTKAQKVLDTWLTATRLGQASNCFVYWKDNVSGDTWGLNFTSAADARTFRECIASAPATGSYSRDSSSHHSGGHGHGHFPRRAESSYSLRDHTHQSTSTASGQQTSKAGSGAHLTTKYYANRTAISTPNSPSKRRIQSTTSGIDSQTMGNFTSTSGGGGVASSGSQAPCTCDCLNADALHKQRNGRIRYANFTRQDSGGTTQSSRSDGSLVRRQHERQQQYYRQNTRSMDEHSRNRICPVSSGTVQHMTMQPTTIAMGKAMAHRRVQALQQRAAGQQMVQQHPTCDCMSHGVPMSQVNGGVGVQYQQQQQQQQQQHKAIVHTQPSGQARPGGGGGTSIEAQVSTEPRTANAASQVTQLVSTATTTDDLPQQDNNGNNVTIRRSQRPKSLMAINQQNEDNTKSRDRSHRSLEGRRRSLERMQCVDLTDASPPTPAKDSRKATSAGGSTLDHRPSAAQLDEYERELRRRLLHGGDSSTNDQLETFETLLKESMEDVAKLMREVQQEIIILRAEERRAKSQSTQSLHRLSSSGLGSGGVPHRSPVWDTLSIDGQLPFLPSFASSLAHASNAYHNAYQSFDRFGGYLTGSEVSDDDRASLNTAPSDDEDGGILSGGASVPLGTRSSSATLRQHSSSRASISTTGLVNYECFGSIRKTGFLSVKKWLIKKKHSLELARKRGWKGYWVSLKGTTLLFYSCEMANPSSANASGNNSIASGGVGVGGGGSGSGNNSVVDTATPTRAGSSASEFTPKHLIFVENCLVQAVPEHPRRDNVFCLSTSFGDAYLFDAASLPDRDQWIAALHTACAAHIARNSGKCQISQYITEECQRLERLVKIDVEGRQETEQALTYTLDSANKQQMVTHVLLLDDKIEKNRLEIFRFKSYLAALKNEEGPNPKNLLSQASRRSKAQLNRIGVFTVSSLHAYNSAKNSQPMEKLHKKNSFSADYIRELYSPSQAEVPIFASNTRVTVQVLLLTGEQRTLEVPSNWTSEQVMADLFGAGAEFREYFFRCSQTGTILFRNDLIGNYANHILVVTPKLLFTIELIRVSTEILFGFSVESELINNDLRVFASRVEAGSLAAIHGLCRHDELMVINGALVNELDMMFVESVLQEELTLCLMIRSARMDMPTAVLGGGPALLGPSLLTKSESAHQLGSSGPSLESEKVAEVTDEFIESLVCPPPPSTDFSQLILSETQLSKFIVPKVDAFFPITTTIAGTNSNPLYEALLASNTNIENITGNIIGSVPLSTGQTMASGVGLLGLSSGDSLDNPSSLLPSNSTVASIQVVPTTANSKPNLTGPDLYQSYAQELAAKRNFTSGNDATDSNLQTTILGGPTNMPVSTMLGGTEEPSNTVTNTTTVAITPEVAAIKHMQKLLRELLDTETTYGQSLDQLVKLYLEPLSQNNFLTATDVKVLFGSIMQIIEEQSEFRADLTEVGEHILGDCEMLLERAYKQAELQQQQDEQQHKESEPSVNQLGVGYIADCFLKHCSNFRNYSTFCASHARAVKLMADEKTALNEWLQARSSGQISQSLESYLIRPIQRVLKYPLLLAQMKALCAKGTTNYNKLDDAVKELEKVGEHINEMQRINDEYGAIFEHLARNHARMAANGPTSSALSSVGSNGLVDLSPTALMHYGNVEWINSMEFLGKNCRKGVELNSICFVFRQYVVFLCKETIRHRKRLPAARSTDVEIIRHQMLIPVIEVQVRASPQSDTEPDFRWDLIQLKMNAGKRSEKIYKLSNKTSEARNNFLHTIRQIIREDVRQMNVFSTNFAKVGANNLNAPPAGTTGFSGSSNTYARTRVHTRTDHPSVPPPPSLPPSISYVNTKQDNSKQTNKHQRPQPTQLNKITKHRESAAAAAAKAAVNKTTMQQQSKRQQQQSRINNNNETMADVSCASRTGTASTEDECHKVPCGLCGKGVELGKREKELLSTTANWRRRQQDSITTTTSSTATAEE